MSFFNSLSSVSVTVTVSWTLFCSSSLFTSHDAGRLASWLAGSHCGYVAVIVSGAATKQKCIDVWPIWSSSMNEELQTALSRPLHMACFAQGTLQALIFKVLHKIFAVEGTSVISARNTLLIIGNQASKQKMKHNSASVDSFLLVDAFCRWHSWSHGMNWPLRMCQNCQGLTHINRWSLTALSSLCLLLPLCFITLFSFCKQLALWVIRRSCTCGEKSRRQWQLTTDQFWVYSLSWLLVAIGCVCETEQEKKTQRG